MQQQALFGNKKIFRLGMALFVNLASLGAGMLGLIYPSNYSPILFLGAVAAVVILIVWISKPVLALYVTLFVVLLPVGIMPLGIHSQLNRILTIIAFGTWALNMLMTHRRIFWSSTASVMLAFLVWSLLTMLWADRLDAAITLIQTYALRFILFIFLITNTIRTKRSLDGLFITLAMNGWILLGFGVITLLQEGYSPGSRFRILGINENAASTLGLITLLGVLWVTTQLSQRKRALKIFLAIVFSLLLIALILASGSRGASLSFGIMIFTFLFWRPLRPWALLCIAILVLAIILTPSLFITIMERFLVQTGDSMSLLGGRETLWGAGWQMIGEQPLGGVGIGNARYSILPFLTDANSETGVSMHNPILMIWGETGLLGILLYVGILISAALAFIKQYLHYRNIKVDHPFIPYFALVSSVSLGYLASWVKGGSMEMAFSYFFMIALLLIPSGLDYSAPSIDDKTGAL